MAVTGVAVDTCATLLLAANVNTKIESERLGHASVTLTLDTYSHVLPTMQRAAADQLEQMPFRQAHATVAEFATF